MTESDHFRNCWWFWLLSQFMYSFSSSKPSLNVLCSEINFSFDEGLSHLHKQASGRIGFYSDRTTPSQDVFSCPKASNVFKICFNFTLLFELPYSVCGHTKLIAWLCPLFPDVLAPQYPWQSSDMSMNMLPPNHSNDFMLEPPGHNKENEDDVEVMSTDSSSSSSDSD